MLQNKKRFLFLFVVSMIAYFSSNAQNKSLDSISLREGVWALQFGISSNFTFTSFQGTTFSAKYQLSDKSAIRGGISIAGSSSDGNNSAFGLYADTSIGSLSNLKSSSSSQSISFILQYLWYVNPNGPIHFFVGIGPSVSYSYTQSSSSNPNNNTSYLYTYISGSSSTQWGAGVAASIGGEWFLSQWFSLRAEYGESLQYRWGSSTSMYDYSSTYTGYVPRHFENDGTSKGWSLANSAVSFGLNVYW
jgi:hypothetical protein